MLLMDHRSVPTVPTMVWRCDLHLQDDKSNTREDMELLPDDSLAQFVHIVLEVGSTGMLNRSGSAQPLSPRCSRDFTVNDDTFLNAKVFFSFIM